MNTVQAQALETLIKSRKDLTATIKDGTITIEKNKYSLTDHCTYHNNDPFRVLAFLWSISVNRRTVLTETRDHRIVLNCIKKDGIAQFTLEIEALDPVLKYTSIENVLPQEGTVVKRSRNYPRMVKEIIDSRWFNEMRSMIANFNNACVHA